MARHEKHPYLGGKSRRDVRIAYHARIAFPRKGAHLFRARTLIPAHRGKVSPNRRELRGCFGQVQLNQAVQARTSKPVQLYSSSGWPLASSTLAAVQL